MLHAAQKHATHLLVPGANRRTRYDCWDWRVQVWQNEVQPWSLHRRTVGLQWHLPRNQSLLFRSVKAKGYRHTLAHNTRPHIAGDTCGERHVESLRLPKSEPHPKFRRPKHRCAQPAHWTYMMGSQTKYASYKNLGRSLRKLSTEMVVAPALWTWSIWIHYQAYRRLVWSTQICLNCSLYHCMHCSWCNRHFMEENVATSIKIVLPYFSWVFFPSCVVFEPIYGHFVEFCWILLVFCSLYIYYRW